MKRDDATDVPLEISPEELARARSEGRPLVLVDCREPWEHETARIEGSLLLPLGELADRVDEVPEGEVVVYCHHGIRSMRGALVLRGAGRTDARSLHGGIDLWAEQIDPQMPRY